MFNGDFLFAFSAIPPAPHSNPFSPANIIKKGNLFFQKKRRQLSRIESRKELFTDGK